MNFGPVTILGSGVAACCCTRLLGSADLGVANRRDLSSPAPIVLINSATCSLLADVFRIPTLFENFVPLRRRIVKWGSHVDPVTLPHSGYAVREADLLDPLWKATATNSDTPGDERGWTIYSGKQHAPGVSHAFGSRIAQTAMATLRDTVADACWIESLESGWLFLLPCGDGNASLLSVGSLELIQALDRSVLIRPEIAALGQAGPAFQAFPRLHDPLCAPGWFTCGTAALGFDPICGEGAGNAVREAILASAALRAIARGADQGAVLAHYSTRLLAGFSRHLETCKQFYSAHADPWWRGELSLLEEGKAQVQELLTQAAAAPPRFRLVDFDLEQIADRHADRLT